MDNARLICARLLREGAVERREIPTLEYPEVRAEVERRLSEVGLLLATSAYSEHVGMRLDPAVTAHQAFDSASNLGLKADACALLVVLWARLVLQKRTATDTRQVPGQAALFAPDRARDARDFRPQVRFETLVREFGPALGSRDQLQRLVSQLRRLRFLAGRGEMIEAGPLLELGIDGEKMITFIKRRVLAELMERPAEAAPGVESGSTSEPPGPTVEEQVCGLLKELGGSASMKELSARAGERPERLRQLLRALEEEGRVHRTGLRGTTRYHLRQG